MISKKGLKISPDVLSENLEGEEVLLNLATHTYFGLNATGTRIWELLREGHGGEKIATLLASEWETSFDTARRDVDKLLRTLKTHKLIQID